MDEFEAVIGMEIHAQVKTRRKQFCSCPAENTREISEANRNVCPICLGHPGVLPVLNKEAVRLALLFGVRIGSQISMRSLFARKNYFYPDLPKGYQITQYHTPLLVGGKIEYFFEGELRTAKLERAHLEEDTAKIFYLPDGTAFLDYNRAGIPLLEVVTEPVFRSSKEVIAFLEELRLILRMLGISDANMEEGNFRCEPNVSVRPVGSEELLTKTEIKNLNSFAALAKALDYEIERQIATWRSGGTVQRATLRWNETKEKTSAMRVKETQADYRYFDEPDLPPLVLTSEDVEQAREKVRSFERHIVWDGVEYSFPVGAARAMHFLVSVAGLSVSDARILASEPKYFSLFTKLYSLTLDAREASIWVLQEYRPRAAASRVDELKISAEQIAELIRLRKEKILTMAQAREVFARAALSGEQVSDVIRECGFTSKVSQDELTRICEKVIETNDKVVQDIRRGKVAALKVLLGAVMRETHGSADALQAEEILRNLLKL